MSELRFNEKSSKQFGILEKCPHIPPAKQLLKKTEIPHGTPVITSEGLDAITTPAYSIQIVDATEDAVAAVNAWLTGCGDLWLSCEPGKVFRNAWVNSVDIQYLSRKSVKVNVTFLCDSYRYNVENAVETLEMIQEEGNRKHVSIENSGTVTAQPKLIIESSTPYLIWMNHAYCSISHTGETVLDTENFTVSVNGNIVQLYPDLNKLWMQPGGNYMVIESAGLGTVKIQKNERWY